MKVVCTKTPNDLDMSRAWMKRFPKLNVGQVYEGNIIIDVRGAKWMHIVELDFKFPQYWWFESLEEHRQKKLNELGL